MAKGTTRADVELARIQARAQVHLALIRRGSSICLALATALPILALQGVIHPLAGRTTIISADLPIKLVLSVSVVANIAQGVVYVFRDRSLKILRREKDLLEARQGLDAKLEFDVT